VTGTAVTVTLATLLWMGGLDLSETIAAAVRGSFGSGDAFLSSTLVRATPLMLGGLAVTLAFRSGVLNIGADGQILAGAVASTVVLAGLSGPLGLVLSLVGAAVAGALVSGIAGVLRLRFGVLEVISTIMLNFLVFHTVSYLVRGPLQEPTDVFPQSLTLPPESRLALLVPGTRLHVGFAVAVACAVALWWVMRFTAPGFRLRVIGANPRAAQSAGHVDLDRTRLQAFLASGALAGVAGGVEVTGVTFALYENLSPGYGYTAIAVALLAGLRPLGVIASAVFFGALASGGAAMQRDAGVPSVAVSVIEAGVILAVVATHATLARRILAQGSR
jgi:simple sugar transport system permease protein